jgi:hypothetical protein
LGLVWVSARFIGSATSNIGDTISSYREQNEPRPPVSDGIFDPNQQSYPALDVHVGPPGCPVLLSGQDVIDWRSGSAVSKLNIEVDPNVLVRFSPSGRFIAVATKSQNQTDTGIEIFDATSARHVTTIPGRKDKYLDFLHVTEFGVFFAGRTSGILTFYGFQSDGNSSQIHLPLTRVSSETVAISSLGTHAACVNEERITLVDLKSPGVQILLPFASTVELSVKPPQEANARDWNLDKIKALSFSNDGTQLAACAIDGEHVRIICWQLDGTITWDADFEHRIPGLSSVSYCEWLTDSNGWIVDRSIIDKQDRMPVFIAEFNEQS